MSEYNDLLVSDITPLIGKLITCLEDDQSLNGKGISALLSCGASMSMSASGCNPNPSEQEMAAVGEMMDIVNSNPTILYYFILCVARMQLEAHHRVDNERMH